MITEDKFGLKFEELKEYQIFIKKCKELDFDYKEGIVSYTRNTQFNGEPCDVCGGNKLVNGMGRYVCFDDSGEVKISIFLCGYCVNYLEEKWGIEMDYM